jgi:mRNA interferase RelE/StbE
VAGRYQVEVLPGARRQLQQLPKPIQGKLGLAIRGLAVDPRPRGAKLLSGPERIWRLRVGEYRVLYEIRDQKLVVLVIGLGHRRDVYRRGPTHR